MKYGAERELTLAAFFIALITLGMIGVVTLIMGVYFAVALAGKPEGIMPIFVATAGVAMIGAAVTLFAVFWPDEDE